MCIGRTLRTLTYIDGYSYLRSWQSCFVMFYIIIYWFYYSFVPRGLKRGSEAARLLGLRFLNPLRKWTLSLVYIVCRRVEVFATSRSLVQRSPTDFRVSECDRETSTRRRTWPMRGCRTTGEKTELEFCKCINYKFDTFFLRPDFRKTFMVQASVFFIRTSCEDVAMDCDIRLVITNLKLDTNLIFYEKLGLSCVYSCRNLCKRHSTITFQEIYTQNHINVFPDDYYRI
jgi:hypothetical protein